MDVAVAPTAATCIEPSRSPAWRLFVSRDAYSSLNSPLCSCVLDHRRATAPINRSHSFKLPRKPSSQAVLKLSRAFISRRFPPLVSLAFRYWRREMKMCDASGSCSPRMANGNGRSLTRYNRNVRIDRLETCAQLPPESNIGF